MNTRKAAVASSVFAAAAISGMLAGAATAGTAHSWASGAALSAAQVSGLGAPAIKLCPHGNSSKCKTPANCSGKKGTSNKPGKD